MSVAKTHEIDFGMTCEGCLGAAKRVLAKINVDQVEANIEKKKLYVTTDVAIDELLVALKKTGKSVSYVGEKAVT